jgi:Zn-dependent peptidase ImmA (M78 family)
MQNATHLRARLRNLGLSDSALEAAWPTWWSDAADASTSAQAELRFSLARKLGLDPHSLLEGAEPRFVWDHGARFKHLAGEGLPEQTAITSFGNALGRYLVAATRAPAARIPWDSISLRRAILGEQPHVRLVDLVSASWALGIPTIHLRVFPLARKRMSAMSVRVDDRSAIMLGRDSMYPPHVAFYLAHELGHISLGHLLEDPVVVDFDTEQLDLEEDDQQEAAADRFALELLTGFPEPRVLPKWAGRYTAAELARVARQAAPELAIEPGTLALCFGFSTGNWATANAAIRRIYDAPHPVWTEVNRVALGQLAFDAISDDAQAYLTAVLGTGML